jgi:protein O-mannosyl-transferase
MEKAIASVHWKYALFVVFIVLLVYAPAARFPFLVLDDTPFIINNSSVHDWSWLPFYFTGAAGQGREEGARVPNLYRPMPGTWTLLNYKMLGLRPGLWHLLAVLLYALGVVLLWRVALKLTGNDFIALAAALLYGLHPLHVEGVVWLSGACVEMMLNIFFLAGFLAYLHWRENGSTTWLLGFALLTLCALLSKETAIALPVLICVHALVFRKRDVAAVRRAAVLPIVAMVVTVALYVAMRRLAIHGIVAPSPHHRWADVLRTAPLLFVTYIQHALWPANLGMWYDTPIVTSLNDPKFWLPLLGCIVYAATTIWLLRRKSLAGFFLLWWAIALIAPIVGVLAFQDGEILHDRFAFVALAGLCMLVACVLERIPARGKLLFGFSASSVAVTAVLTILLGALTVRQVITWHSDMAMYSHAVEASPGSVKPRLLLANEFLKRNDIARALELDREALAINPHRWDSLFAYGITLASAGQNREAVHALAQAARIAPGQTPIYTGWSRILIQSGDYNGAIQVLRYGITVADSPEILQEQLARLLEALRAQRPQ